MALAMRASTCCAGRCRSSHISGPGPKAIQVAEWRSPSSGMRQLPVAAWLGLGRLLPSTARPEAARKCRRVNMVFLSFGGQGWPQAVLTIASAGGLTNTASMCWRAWPADLCRLLLGDAVNPAAACRNGVDIQLHHVAVGEGVAQRIAAVAVGAGITKLRGDDGVVAH